jgi:hypothetical protein
MYIDINIYLYIWMRERDDYRERERETTIEREGDSRPEQFKPAPHALIALVTCPCNVILWVSHDS